MEAILWSSGRRNGETGPKCKWPIRVSIPRHEAASFHTVCTVCGTVFLKADFGSNPRNINFVRETDIEAWRCQRPLRNKRSLMKKAAKVRIEYPS